MASLDPPDEQQYLDFLDEIGAEFPELRLIQKRDSLLQRSIGVALRVLTFGGQRRYMKRYVTTIGMRIYLPYDWDERPPAARIVTLRHERVHLRQFRRWTLPLMAVLYVLFPLPMGLSWARMRFEREAYEETLRAAVELYGPSRVRRRIYRKYVIGQFVTGRYGWMWPFRRSLERWYDELVATL